MPRAPPPHHFRLVYRAVRMTPMIVTRMAFTEKEELRWRREGLSIPGN